MEQFCMFCSVLNPVNGVLHKFFKSAEIIVHDNSTEHLATLVYRSSLDDYWKPNSIHAFMPLKTNGMGFVQWASCSFLHVLNIDEPLCHWLIYESIIYQHTQVEANNKQAPSISCCRLHGAKVHLWKIDFRIIGTSSWRGIHAEFWAIEATFVGSK